MRDAFKKAEMNWLKERQSLLKEIDSLEAERGDIQGYRSNRPEREYNSGKDNNVGPRLLLVLVYLRVG